MLEFLVELGPLLLCSLLLRILCFTGPVGSDDGRYVRLGLDVLAGHLSPGDHAATRLVFLAIIGSSCQSPLGVSGAYLLGLAIASALDVLILAVCYSRFGSPSALLAGVWLCFNKIAILQPTLLLPDLYVAFSMAGFIVVWTTNTSRIYAQAIALGVILGISLSLKETAVLLLPPILLCSYLEKRPISWLLLLLAAWATTSATIDVGGYYLLTGDPLFKWKLASGKAVEIIKAEQALAGGRFASWSVQLRGLLDYRGGIIPVILGVPLILFIHLRHKSSSRIASTSGLMLLFYSLFGSASLREFVPLPIQERYLYPLIPISAIALAELSRSLSGARLRLLTLVFSGMSIWGIVVSLFSAGQLYFCPMVRQVKLALSITRGTVFVPPDIEFRVSPFLNQQEALRLKAFDFRGDAWPDSWALIPAKPQENSQFEGVLLGDQRNMRRLLPALTREWGPNMMLIKFASSRVSKASEVVEGKLVKTGIPLR